MNKEEINSTQYIEKLLHEKTTKELIIVEQFRNQ